MGTSSPQLGRGLTQAELVPLATCVCCQRKIGKTGAPLFYLLTIERHGLDAGAIRRASGLEAMLGSPMLAQVMGPNEALTVPVMPPVRAMVCESCSTEPHLVAQMVETAAEMKTARESVEERS
jgi:hypothetical protein